MPKDWYGAQLFIYPALEAGEHSRLRAVFRTSRSTSMTRADVHRVHEWAVAHGHEILNEPRPFPEYGETFYATFFVDMHGFMLEAVSFEAVEVTT